MMMSLRVFALVLAVMCCGCEIKVRVASEPPKPPLEPGIHPDIRGDWFIQVNPESGKFRPMNRHHGTPLFILGDTKDETIRKLNEYHLKNIRETLEESKWVEAK
jgi:hypothetical protein